jgi:hypothetical protein
MADCSKKTGQSKENAASQNDDAPLPYISQDAEEWLNDIRNDTRKAERQSDLNIIQAQVGPYERPGRFGNAKDQFIDKFNQKVDEIRHGYEAKGLGASRWRRIRLFQLHPVIYTGGIRGTSFPVQEVLLQETRWEGPICEPVQGHGI